MEIGNDDVLGRLQPVGLGEHRGNDVGNVESTSDKENDLDLTIGASKHKHPNENGRDGNRDISADVKHFHGRSNAGKLGHDVRQIHKEPCHHHKKSGTEAELFANQIG